MITAEITDQVLQAGGQIAVDGGDLVLTAARPLPPDLLDKLKAHKAELLAALRGPRGRCPVVNLEDALQTALAGVEGITPAQFRALLSAEDIKDIEAGDIPVPTLKGFAQSFAEGIRSGSVVVLAQEVKP